MDNKQDQLINMQITQALQGNRILLDSTPWDRGPALKFSIPFLRKQESSKNGLLSVGFLLPQEWETELSRGIHVFCY